MKSQHPSIPRQSRLPSPAELRDLLPAGGPLQEAIARARDEIRRIIHGIDDRLLVIAGPCSIHDPAAALDYARRLCRLRTESRERMMIVMRCYVEKPRTVLGWKGLINDPLLDGSCDIGQGLHTARRLLIDISAMGMPIGMEFLDPLVAPCLVDLVSWAAVGARTVESQVHRELASGLPMPAGFKNGMSGCVDAGINAIVAAQRQHSFLSIDEAGRVCAKRTSGNPDGHLVLRGGRHGANCDATTILSAVQRMRDRGIHPAIIVDCSHMNCNRDPERQIDVWDHVLELNREGIPGIIGMMIESNLKAGNQPVAAISELEYGVSVTDPCLGWEKTERLLRAANQPARLYNPLISAPKSVIR
jgi:3-deoxy-7-phosphoheptulonate synthase